MCGIVGLINKNKTDVDLPMLTDIASTLNHRGPDDEGSFIDNYVGLYHKRLSIIDLDSGHQPMLSGPFTIVFNGEIYNYIELREELRSFGYKFRTKSDTEVILKLYEHYGPDCVKKLNGMFAFIIYDKKRKKIFAARDHFGIKPLYYYHDSRFWIFASEIKAILKHPHVKSEANNSALQEYLTFQFLLGDTTLFNNVYKVIPGNYILIDLNTMNFETVKYWDPNFNVDVYHTEEYFVSELRRLLEDAIKLQLRSDVPVGAYLSGGMDSSIVSILASQNSSHKLNTFTGAFREGKEFDESNYAKLVSDYCGAESNIIYPSAEEFVNLMPKLIYHLDEPLAGPGLFPQYMVSKLASEKVKVVLGGQGGDEIYGGYTRYLIAYLEQALKGAICETNEEGEHIVSLTSILPNLPFIQSYIPMLKEFWKQDVFESMDKRYYKLIDRNNGNDEYYSKEFKLNYNKDFIFKKFRDLFNHPDTLSYYNKMTHFDMFGSMPALLQVEDRMSMAVSIESRVPLLDHRLVQLIAGMPPAMKFKGAEMKYILRRAVDDLLPPQISNRKDKMGFPVPLHMWAKNEARSFIMDTLLSSSSRNRGIFDIDKIEKLILNERTFGRQLWGVLCLELWFNQFIDNSEINNRKEKYEVLTVQK